MLGKMRKISGNEACPLRRAACLLVHAESAGTTALLAAVTCAGHVALGVIEFRGRKLIATEALTGILGSCNLETASGTEGDASLIGDVIAVEVAPLGKRSRRDGVDEAAGVNEA
jgi:hypothetical protein